MRKSITIVMSLILVTSNTWAASFVVTPPPGNWNKVQSLPQGANLVIELKQRQEITGEFVRLADDAIVIRELEKERTYPRDSVARIKLVRPGSRVRYAAIYGGILFGVGFGVGYALAPKIGDDDNMPGSERASAGAGVGAIMGGIAAIIALARNPGTRDEVVYQAR